MLFKKNLDEIHTIMEENLLFSNIYRVGGVRNDISAKNFSFFFSVNKNEEKKKLCLENIVCSQL